MGDKRICEPYRRNIGMCHGLGWSVYDVTHFWTTFDPLPIGIVFSTKPLVLSSQNPSPLIHKAVSTFMNDPFITNSGNVMNELAKKVFNKKIMNGKRQGAKEILIRFMPESLKTIFR